MSDTINISINLQALRRIVALITFSLMSIGILTSQCLSTLPNAESFETDFGPWMQSVTSGFSWVRHTGSTPTSGTGPVGAMNGSYYIYADAATNTNKVASIEACFDLTAFCAAEIEYNYHMLGSNVGQLRLDASTDNGLTWNNIWTEIGDQGVSWYVAKVDLNTYAGAPVFLRFSASNTGPFGDIALDNVRLRAFQQPKIGDITSIDPMCGATDGSITIDFADVPNIDSIQFSLDGAATWSAPIADNSGSVIFPSLGGGTYDLWVRNKGDNCRVDLPDETLKDLPLPTVTFTMADLDYCVGDGSFKLTGGSPANGVYTGTGVIADSFNPTIAGQGVHTITYTFTDTNGCSDFATQDITVYAVPVINYTLTTDTDCEYNATLALSGGLPTGGTYSGNGVTGTNFDASAAGVGTHTITYTFTDTNGCTNKENDDITVFARPNVALTLSNDKDCENNSTLVLSGGIPTGGTYSGAGVSGTNFDASAAGVGTHTITYSYTDGNGCESTATDDIVVFAQPTVNLALTTTTTCENENVQALTEGLPSGGTYSGVGVTGTNFDASAAGVGVHTVTYTYTDGNGCQNTATDDIEVFVQPIVTLSFSAAILCDTETTFALNQGAPSGGVYSGTGVAGNNFDPSIAGIGIHTIAYTYTDANGCLNKVNDDIEVVGPPVVSLSLTTATACNNNSTLALAGGIPTGGTYSGTGVTGTNFDPSNAGVGVHTITYTYVDGNGCENTATDDIAVYSTTTASLNLPSTTDCIANSTYALDGGTPSGGTFSGPGVTGNNFDASTAGIGVHAISYSFTNANGCEDIATEDIEVFASPTATLSLANTNDCVVNSNLVLSGGSPAGGTYSGPGVSGTNFSATAAGIGTHTITYTYTDANGCSATATDDIVVYDTPTVGLALPSTTDCLANTAFALSGGTPSGGTFSGPGVTGTNFDASAAGIGIHAITYVYTDGNGCENTATENIQVFGNPTVSLTLSNDSDCEANTTLALAGGMPSGGTYSGPGVTGTNFDATAAGLGAHTITYTYTDGNGCENTATDEIVVHSLTTVSLTLTPDDICEDEPGMNLTGGIPSGGTFSGPGVSGTWFDVNVAGVGNHTITYTYTDPAGCINSATDILTVYALPIVTLTLNEGEACIDEVIALGGASPTGGTYSGPGVTGTSFDASVAGVGTHTITYTYTDGNGCTQSATDFVVVFGLPIVNFNLADTETCITESGYNLSGGVSPAGGTFSGTGVTGNVFDANVAGVGVHTLTYTYTDGNGCVNTATEDMNVFALPTVTFNLTDTETCITESGYNLSGGVSPSGGTFSGPGVSGNIFDANVAGVGVHTLTYTYSDGNGCVNTATEVMEVFALPNAELFLTDDEDCSYNTTLALGGGTPFGGTYSGPGVTGGNFDATAAGIGTHTITYTYTNGNGCTDTATDQMVVHADTFVGLFLNDDTECINNTTRALTEGQPAGGTYSGPGVAGTNFDATVAGIGTHTITYTFTDANGCTFSGTDDITVGNPPAVSLVLVRDDACEDYWGFNLEGGSPAGGSWSGPGVSGNYFDVALAGPGTHTITYSYTDWSTGCTNTATQNVYVYSLPNVVLDFANDNVCLSESTYALTEGIPSGGTYSGPGVSGTNFNPSSVGLGTHTITYSYTDANGCSNTTTDQIEVVPLPITSLSLPNTTFCINDDNETLSGGVPVGGTFSGPGVTGNILDIAAAGIGPHTITYTFTDANGCENSSSQNIAINNIPPTSFVLSDDVACLNDITHPLDGVSPTGGTFSGPGVVGNQFSTTIAGVGTHTITYTVVGANGCINTATDELTVASLPVPNLSLAEDEACVDVSSVALSGGSPAGGSWSGPGVSGSTFDPSAAGVGTHTIIYSFSAGDCYAQDTEVFTVHALPTPTLSLTDTDLCIGERIFLSGESPTGGSWSGPGVNGNRFRSNVAGIGTHTITYTYKDANGCEASVTDQITVHDLPIVSLSLPIDEDCESNTSLALSGGSPAGGTYDGNGVTGTNFNANAAGAGDHEIVYYFIDANGCENKASQVITVYEVPDVKVVLDVDEACIVESPVTLSQGRPLGGVWSGPGVSGNQIDPAAAGLGTHTITYTYTINGCTDSDTDQFTVYALPTVTLSMPDVSFCLGEVIDLTGGSPSGGTYSGPGVNSNNSRFRTVVAGLGTHTITYTYKDANGCEAIATQNVTVHDLPSASFTLGNNEGCASDNNIVLSGGTPAGGYYSGPGVTGNIMDATHPSAGQGTHTITYTYTDANGCEAQAIDDITIYSTPDVNFTTIDEHCGKNDGSISLTYTNNFDILWIQFSLDGGSTWQNAVRDNTGGNTYNFLSSGSYDIVVRNANGTCEHAVGTAVINNINGPTANAGTDVTIYPPNSTTLNGSGGNFYSWTPALGLSNANIPNPIASPQVTTTYTLVVTDLYGCKDSDQVTVTVVPPCAGTIVDGEFPYRESFESGIGLWSQEPVADNFDWARNSGGTPTGSTGPSSAIDGTYYYYAEADGNTNQTAIFKSPCFDLNDQSCAQFTFDYHMYGSAMGNLRVEASVNYGQSWTTVWTESSDHGNLWNTGTLDLLGYVDQILQLRIVANIGGGVQSDIAIDNVEFITTGCGCDDTSSPFENFALVPDPMPVSIDIDCDGDADMLAGSDSQLFFFENNGDGTYTDQTGTANDIMPNLSHKDMTLGFADLDGDGDYDMSIVGEQTSNKRFYWNVGTKTNPIFQLATGANNPIANFDLSPLDGGYWIGYADPTIYWVDLDGDNDYDAVIGGKLGWFLYYENIGDENNPNFVNRTGSANPFNGLRADGEDEGTPSNPCPGSSRCQYESSPLMIDWDGDGDYDMFSGNQISTVQYFENIGTATNPQFVERTGSANPFDGVIFSEDSHLSIIDEDCDGDWDVFYGVGDTNEDAEITLCDLLVAVPNNAIASADQSNYCTGNSVYFEEAGTTGVSWQWSGPNGFTSNIQNPYLSNIDATAAGTYTVTITNDQGCEHISSIDITVSGATADAGSGASIDLGDSVPLNGSGNGVTFQWSPCTGLSDCDILNPTATPLVTTTYVLTVTDFYGCTATSEVTIYVASDACEEEANIFEADFENTTGDNFWTMNTAASDGDWVIDVPTPYTTAGNLMESTAHTGNQSLLTGVDVGRDLDGGPATARSRNITISPTATNVNISFYWYYAHAYNGNSADNFDIEIRDASNGSLLATLVSETGANYNRPAVWQFHNGDLSSLAGKTIYIWVDAADNPNGSKTEAAIDEITITETFETIATFNISPTDYCEEDPIINLTGGTPAGGTYSGPGVTGSTFDPSTAGPGIHPIVYQYTSNTGCIATASADVQVFELPQVSIDLAVPEACDTETSVALFGGLPTGGTYSGTGITGSTMNPSAAGPGTHVVTYTVIDANGCENSITADFVVNSAPVVTSVTSVDASCDTDNGSITMNFNDVAGITNLQFSLNGALSWETAVPDNSGSVTYSDLPVGTYNVWVRDADAACDIDLGEVTIEDLPNPQVDAGLDQLECDGGSASVTATVVGGSAPLTYAWSGPGNFTSTTLAITMTNEGIYTITVTDVNGCTATDAVYLQYLEVEPGQISDPEISCPDNDPDPIESLEPGVSCNKLDNHEFIHDNTGNWYLYQNASSSATLTTDTNSELSGENSAFVDISTIGGSNWHLMLVQNFGAVFENETYEFTFEAKASAPKTIQVQLQEAQAPYANLGIQTFNIGTTASTYTWSGIAPNIDHNNVKIQFRIAGDLTDIWIDNAVLQPTSCSNTIIDYKWECRESNGAGGWSSWSEISGATSDTYDPPVITNVKEYRRLASIQGCDDFEYSNIVSVELCPCEVIAEGENIQCPYEAANLNATGTGVGPLTYSWSPAAGLSNANIANPTASPTTTTTYTVTMTDANGCTATDDVTITVSPPINVIAEGDDEIICSGEASQLTANAKLGYSSSNFKFINSGGSYGPPPNLFNGVDDTGGSTFVASKSAPGQDWGIAYELGSPQTINAVGLERRDDCCSNRAQGGVVQVLNNGAIVYQSNIVTGTGSDEIFASPAPNIVGDEVRYIFLNGVDTEGGPLLNFTEWNIYTSDVTYFWGPAAGLSNPNIANPIASPSATTTYTVTVTDVNGCTGTDDVTITILPKVENIVITSVDASCGQDNGSITITWTTPAGVTDIAFSLDGGTTFESAIAASIGTVTYSNLPVGFYDLQVKRNDDSCLEDIADVTITDLPAPTVDAGSDHEICAGDSASITPNVTGGTAPVTYAWSGPAGMTSSSLNVTATVGGNYVITVTDNSGCTATDIVTVKILDNEPGQIVMPTIDCPANDPGVITSLEPGSACNILGNNEFDEGTSVWAPYVHANATATMTIDNNGVLSGDNSLYVDITAASGTGWHIMPYQVVGAVQASQTYELSFEAVAAANKNVRMVLQEAQTPYTTYATQTIAVGTTPNTYTWSAIAPGIDHNNLRLLFIVGDDDTNIWLDNAVLEETNCTEPIIEYQWECRESNGAGGWSAWTTIPAATGDSYDPPVQTSDKQYRRLSNVLGCNDSAASNVVEVELCPCEVIASGQDASICYADGTLLTATGTGVGNLSYAWSPAASLSDATIPSPYANPTATTSYVVTVTDENGCTATDDLIVSVLDTTVIYCQRYRLRYGTDWQPWINFNGDCVIELCEDGDLNDFQFDGGPDINTGWVWTDEDGNVDTEVDEIVAFGNIGLNDAGIYTGVLTNGEGCTSTLYFEVIVHPNVVADAGPDDSYCEGAAAVTLTASGGSTYLWDDPAGSTTASISVNPTVTTTYSVTVTEGSCSDVDDVTVTVYPNPTADAGADDEFCAGEDTQLSASGGDTYEWSPATGLSNANIANPIASPTTTTTYTVTVTDINGCTDTDELTITIQQAPEVTGVAHTDASCGEDNGDITITFNDVSGIVNIQFSLDGGNTWETAVADASGTITYSDMPAGTYDLWVRKANGFCVLDIDDATIATIPVVTVDLGPEQEVCPGDSGTFTATVTDGTPAYTYAWEGPAGYTSTAASITVNLEGPYVVTVTDANGCTSTDISALQVQDVEAGLIGEPTMQCPENDPGTITSVEDPSACNFISNHEVDNGIAGWYLYNYTALINPPATRYVDNTGVLSGDNSMYFDIPTATGVPSYIQLIFFYNEYLAGETYTVSFEAMAEAPRDIFVTTNLAYPPYTQYWSQAITLGTTPNTYTFTITPTQDVDHVRLSFFIGQNDTNFWLDNMEFKNVNCVEPTFDYFWQCRTSDGAGGWSGWNTIPGANGSTYDPPVQTETKQYRRRASVQGCNTYQPSNVVEVEICPCEINAGTDETICFGGSTTLNPAATGFGNLTYAWSPATGLDNAGIENPTASPTATTIYTVTVTDENGCTVSDDVAVTVEQLDFADAGPDQTICEGNSTDLIASGGISYEWDDPTAATTATVTVSPTVTTTYTVTVTDADGCIDTDQVVVTPDPAPTVTVPDAQICADEMATLTSNVSGGQGTVSYQWQKSHGGNLWNDIPGATSATYTTPPLLATSYYRLIATWTGDGCEEAISNTATVTVDPASVVANVVAGEDTLCIGESTILTVNDGIESGGQIDYSNWTLGDGSITGFRANGHATENNRINGTDPWGNSTIVWEGGNDVDNNADGGWNTARFDIDHTKTYRFSVWINRKVIGANGRAYLGSRGYGGVNGLERVSDGSLQTNPYFWYSTIPPSTFDEDQWVLIVGHVFPSNSTGTSNHPDSGKYTLCDGRIGNTLVDYRWLPETLESVHRNYLFYSTDTDVRQQFLYPRVDIVDGTEPSIDEILYGFDATKGLGTGATYEWFTGSCGGTPVGVGPTLPVTPTQTTTYYVRATGTCNTTECEEITVVVKDPQVTLDEPTDTCVNGDDMTLTATPPPGTEPGDSGVFTPFTGLTDNGDGTATIDVDVVGSGSYDVTYTYTDGTGCVASETSTVTILDIPTPDAGIDVVICEGDTIQLAGTGGGTYLWSPTAGLSDPSIANPTANPTVTTTYVLTVTNGNGCSATDEVTVTVNESLDATAIALSHDYCLDGTGEATVTITNGTGPFTIEWQTTTGTENGSDTLSTTGDYTITGLNGGTTYCIEVTDANGCKVQTP